MLPEREEEEVRIGANGLDEPTHKSINRATFGMYFRVHFAVVSGMKRDGRSFDHRTLEAIRLIAVERVRGGERPSSVIASFRFCRTTIYKWLKAAAKPGDRVV